MGKPSWYVTNHPGQLSLATPPWVGTMSTSESWDVDRHTAQCTGPVSVVWQCKLVSGWWLMKRTWAPPYGSYGSGRTLRFTLRITVKRYNRTNLNWLCRRMKHTWLFFQDSAGCLSGYYMPGTLSSNRHRSVSLAAIQNGINQSTLIHKLEFSEAACSSR